MAEMSVNTHPDVVPPYESKKEKILRAYTALDRLLDALGDEQSWAAVPTTQLSTIKEETGYTHLVVDYFVSNIVRKMSKYEG